jgi:branched-chain amino acid transport system substrate-binding protein
MSRVRWLALFSLLLGVAALTVAACGGDDDNGGGGGGAEAGETLDIYSSLPLQGAQRLQTTALVNGIKLALDQHGGKAGKFKIKYTSLDDSTAQAGTWTPEAASANARKVAKDDKAIAYIGEFNSGASAISIPILNEVPILQLSPANTAVGLTSDEPGADKGEPEKYYPTGNRNYARIVPKDTVQGAALAALMKEDGCTSVYILNDKEVYGAGLATNIETSAKKEGLKVAGNEGIDPKAPNFRSQAATIKSSGADCFVFSGVTPNGAVQLYKDVSAAVPDAKLYGPDGVSNPEFFNPKEGGVPNDIGAKTKVTVATLSPDQYPPEGRKFFEQYKSKYGVKSVDPYAIYGYEAMSLILDTCKQLGSDCSDKQAMIDAIFQTKGRKSVLGTYDIDENGDTTITDYGVYKIKNGELVFDETIKPGAS